MTSPSIPRSLVVDALTAELPAGVKLIAHSRNTTPARATVMVRTDTVEPRPEVGPDHRRYTFALILLVPDKDPNGPADDRLDALLEQVLAGVDAAQALTWTAARRATFDQDFPAYEITVIVHTSHAQRSTP